MADHTTALQSVDQRVVQVFRTVFPAASDYSENRLSAEVQRGRFEPWDSLSHVILMSALNEEFEIEIAPEESLSVRTFGDVRRLVQELVIQ